ncbi:hypothetical protein BH24ACT5_BH24ACT5_07030 [soil metagenome]
MGSERLVISTTPTRSGDPTPLGMRQPGRGRSSKRPEIIRPAQTVGVVVPALARLEQLDVKFVRRQARRERRRRIVSFTTVTLALLLVGGASVALFTALRTTLDVEGLADGQELTRHGLDVIDLRIVGSDDITVAVNGEDIPLEAAADGTGFAVDTQAVQRSIVPGANTLVVSQARRYGLGDQTVKRSFTYDPSGPTIMVPTEMTAATGPDPETLRGLVDDATSLTANGVNIPLEPGGGFTVFVPTGTDAVDLIATDAEGNAEPATVLVTSTPGAPDYPETRAVHVTARGWADPVIHDQIMQMVDAGLINAVQLDIKNEGGEVGYASTVPLAVTIGSSMGHYDAPSAIAELHARDVRVIGRIVCFLDPPLAKWAWNNERPDMLVLDADGEPLPTDYGTAAFTNVGNADVRQYEIDLAVEAAGLGFDEILYDYVRRPEGNLTTMQFPGMDSTPDVAVARFVAQTADELAPLGTRLGISVFGIAATRPGQIGQDIRLLAPHVDFVAPMVYPSHWGPGEYGVASPNRQPGDIVGASVADFQRIVAGSGAAVVPWLQDFSAGGVTYGEAEVRAQIDATAATGSPGFILWNSGNEYTPAALMPTTTTTLVPPTTVAAPAAPTTAPAPTTTVAVVATATTTIGPTTTTPA